MTRADKDQEAVAAALNEQGDILRYKMIRLFQSGEGRQNHGWCFEESDVPVSLPKHCEIRVDIVLKRRPFSHLLDSMSENQWHMVMKCKQPALGYDRWVFSSNNGSASRLLSNHYHIECAEAFGKHPNHYKHTLKTSNALEECPVFEKFVETRIETPSNSHKLSPPPAAIKNALRQVTLGQTGIANKLRRGQTQMFSLIPVVVTTAKLMSAQFGDISGFKVQPKDLKLEPRKWLALNYHLTDETAHFFTKNHIKPTSIAGDVSSRLVRTIFVVQADHILPFLEWLGEGYWRVGQR